MANKNSERTSLMKKEFIKLRASGMSIQDIAKKYGMTARNIYFHLQEIADEYRPDAVFIEYNGTWGVGDVYEIVPKLAARIKAEKGNLK